jgi:hypothetical protein
MWFLALLSVVGTGVLFGLSIFPGLLEQVPDRPAFILCVIFAVAAGGFALLRLMRPVRPDQPRRRASAIVVLVALVLASSFLTARVPRRAVFRAKQSEFEALLVTAPLAGNRAAVGLNAEIMPYWIDQWGTDVRGGTYFRTLVGIGPEGGSFGFAFQPNMEGTPFGDAGYRLQHLTGDWYSFAASER